MIRDQRADRRSQLETPAARDAARADLEQRLDAARVAGRARRKARQDARTARRAAHHTPAAPGTLSPRSEATDDASSALHGGAAREAVSLVSTAEQTPWPEGQQTAADGEMKRLRLRDQRRRLREAIQRLTRLSGLRGCGTSTTGELIGVHVGTAAVRFAGLQSCHSVWACPICQARIRAARAVELERAALAWLKAGHGLYMATLTVPHWEHVRLASRVKDGHKCAGQRSCTCPCKCPVLAPGPGQKRPPCTCACPVDPGQLARVVEAWRGVQGGTWWVGRDVIQDGAPAPWPTTAADRLALETDGRYVRRQEFGPDGRPLGPATVWQEGFRDRWGIVGTTRTIEITWGANGWHSHAHVLIWTEDEATDARAERIEEELYNRWAKRCKAVGLPTPARGEIRPKDGKRIGKGVDVTAATREKAGAVGKYVIKLQEGGNLAMEMTRADLKVARGQKGKTALELAAVAASGNEKALELWHEFEFATRGMQCLTWSKGLRERLADLVELDDREDDEIPEEETADTPEKPSLLITRAAWWKSIVPVYGARPDIMHAGEVGGLPGVLAVLDKLGLVHGTDYGPPETMAGPVLPSVDQLRRGQARRQARRDRRQAVDTAVYDRAPAQWAAAQEKRRATIAKQKQAAAAVQAADTEDTAAEIELTQAAAEFARRKARLRQDPAARHDFERGDVEPVRLRRVEDLDAIADARPAPKGTPGCAECGAALAAEMLPYGRHVMC
ncbi:hypothetical protein [Streptomyces parvus]|uniref:hypothetical protein n=1 Tax=Streptomyces parvus TaxID=66428 RepID=UPI002100EB15|nr:hypothetical protein [Streptomyces parvus]MCQ1582604.1 hypothetical protein [Streptomyces parvus]